MTLTVYQTGSLGVLDDPVITFSQADEVWVVNPGVSISSTLDSTVVSAYDHNALVNHGTITSVLHDGASFTKNDVTVTNDDDGKIYGLNSGLSLAGDNATISNAGIIGSLDGDYGVVAFWGAGGAFNLDNSGEIAGKLSAIDLGQAEPGALAQISNSAFIHSAGVAIETYRAASITNDGLIQGNFAAIQSRNGGVQLVNNAAGIISGTVDFAGTFAADHVFNHGKILDWVVLGGGNDSYKGYAGSSAGLVLGGAGRDHLVGANLADWLAGGIGKDTLTGGKGADHFEFLTTADSALGKQHDVITDFRHGQHDRIDLHGIDANSAAGGDQAFVFRGVHAFTAAGQLRYVQHDLAGTAHDSTVIYGSTDADKAPEFQIEVKGLLHFVAGDFTL